MIGVVVMNAVGASASASMLAKIMVLSLVGKVKMLTFLQRCTGHQVVKDMEILLSRWHSCHPVVFETLVEQLDTTQPPLVCELELCIFSKARCIWIKEHASVSKRLDDEFCCGHLARELGTLLSRVGYGQLQERLDGETATFRLSAASFATMKLVNIQTLPSREKKKAPDDEGLVLGCATHVVVSIVGELENVGREGGLVFCRVPVVCGVLLENRVGV